MPLAVEDAIFPSSTMVLLSGIQRLGVVREKARLAASSDHLMENIGTLRKERVVHGSSIGEILPL